MWYNLNNLNLLFLIYVTCNFRTHYIYAIFGIYKFGWQRIISWGFALKIMIVINKKSTLF